MTQGIQGDGNNGQLINQITNGAGAIQGMEEVGQGLPVIQGGVENLDVNATPMAQTIVPTESEPGLVTRRKSGYTAGKIAELDPRQLAPLGFGQKVNQAVLEFADRFAEALDKGEWKKLSRYWASPEHKDTQVDGMGMGYPQYVAELLDLHTVGNSIKTSEVLSAEDMDRIREIDFSKTLATEANPDGDAVDARFWFDQRSDLVVLTGLARVEDAANWRNTDEFRIEVVIDLSPIREGRQPDLIGAVG